MPRLSSSRAIALGRVGLRAGVALGLALAALACADEDDTAGDDLGASPIAPYDSSGGPGGDGPDGQGPAGPDAWPTDAALADGLGDAGSISDTRLPGDSADSANDPDGSPLPDADPHLDGQPLPDSDTGGGGDPDGTTTPDAEPGPDGGETPDGGSPDTTPPPPKTIAELCFSDILGESDTSLPGPSYDQFAPKVGSHCWGTDHQDIEDVELIVFLGDSVTVGTPNLEHALPTDNNHFYRNKLAMFLRDHFGLSDGGFIDFGLWKSYDLIKGVGGKAVAGDFRNCSKWGARTDDFLEGGAQITKCFPTGGSDKRTLVVFTMGGNDIAKITEVGGSADAAEVAAGYPKAWALAKSTVDYLREAVEWLKDPARFPNGAYVVFANPFEFTDGTGKVDACPAAGLAGLKQWAKPEVQEQIVISVLEGFMEVAVDTQSDVIWLLEHFCGHGYVATGPKADTENRCYRGPGTPLYFDETCIHPNTAGHNAIFEMFRDTILE